MVFGNVMLRRHHARSLKIDYWEEDHHMEAGINGIRISVKLLTKVPVENIALLVTGWRYTEYVLDPDQLQMFLQAIVTYRVQGTVSEMTSAIFVRFWECEFVLDFDIWNGKFQL